MNTITTDINFFTTIISFFLILGSIIFLICGWAATYELGDPLPGLMVTVVAAFLSGLIVSLLSTQTHTEFQNIKKYEVLVTDRFVKVFDKQSQQEIVSTSDHFTITNIPKYNAIKHVWYTNIYNCRAGQNDEYSLVEKPQVEVEKN